MVRKAKKMMTPKKLFVVSTTLMCLTQAAFGYSFFNKGKCAYPKEVLQNPDQVIQYQLESGKHGVCDHVWQTKPEIYPPAVGSLVAQDYAGRLHPKEKISELVTKYPEAFRQAFFEPMSGTYREYKIFGKQIVPPIEGMEAIEYTVELLYVSLSWAKIPKINPEGTMPVCERNTVKLYAVNTPLGWYMVYYTDGLGEMHDPTHERSRKSSYYLSLGKHTERQEKAWIRGQQIVDQCKDHLN